ncbi:pre-mRNA-processing factor 39-like [Adelges cooleyi]|uniref:pre-mRNA-processing factor 39-like n=1 Tax=Adelges cooleyi TaxID=133065 RepID=UPI00217FD670|nr:pre-mRNA-processing factor 39-like [Adelges cooleyi]XP_050441250.1 pre-mRNA-processing factor 39-like [Adelges cooleyi]XP_050441251.1 pre-mRNA-processing factor 39-like [Adelges cooleyi]
MADQDDASCDKSKENDNVPELDDTELPKVISTPPTMSIKITSNKLQKSNEKYDENNDDSDECQIILPNTDIIDISDDNAEKDDSAEIKEVSSSEEVTKKQSTEVVKNNKQQLETEMVSEDEMQVDTMPKSTEVSINNKQPDTEEVSEDDLPSATLSDQTEKLSDDELPNVKGIKGSKRPKTLDESEKQSKIDIEMQSQSAKKLKTEEPKPITELDKFWAAVKADPSDFVGWTYLLQYVDQDNNVDHAREAYGKFLALYPYCYGYWRKFADFEKRNNNKEECEKVFERGLTAIPLSVDLWIHYMTYLKTNHADDIDHIRSKFEKGLQICGLEYRSDRLWDHYIKWEIDQGMVQNAFNIYDRLLGTQTLGYLQHFENFKEFVNKNSPDKLLSAKEFLEFRQQISEGLRISSDGELLNDDSAPPGEEEHIFSSDVTEKEELLLKEKIIDSRLRVHKETAQEITKRQTFEEGIKRPYFHVKPLEKCQIDNWKNYIEFEKAAGDHQRIVVIYERCLIACALYEDFWLSYLDYLESANTDVSDLMDDLYKRACLVHHRKSTKLHLKWAAYEETMNNMDKAAEILENLDKAVPHMLQIIYRRINLEKRRGLFDKVSDLYSHYINTSHTKFLTSNIAIKYARFLWKSVSKIDKAIEVISDIINKDKDNMQENARLLLQLVELKMSVKPLDEKSVIQTFDDILSMSSVNLEQKILFSQRKLEFIEDYTDDLVSLRKALQEFKCYSELLAKEKKKAIAAAEEEKSRIEKELKNKQAQELAVTPSTQITAPNYQSYNSTYYPQQQYSSGYNQPYQQYTSTGQDYTYQYQNWSYPAQTNYNQSWGSYNYGSGY